VPLPDGTTDTEMDSLPEARRIQVPGDWSQTLGEDFRGRVLYTRQFNRPTGLEDVVRIELVLQQPHAVGFATLNGKRLGEITRENPSARFEVLPLLRPQNSLAIEVEFPWQDSTFGLADSVTLEIHV